MKKITFLILTLMISGFSALMSQNVTGTVSSAREGFTLPGVTIQIKGGMIGTTTDGNGNYSIAITSSEDTLLVSYVGYTEVEVPISGRQTIDIELQPAVYDLSEVMVTAYGTAKKATFTGSATVVESEDIEKIQATSITQALQGITTGIQVGNTNGQPGSNPQIRIRGISSINGNSNPLIVVDGAPFGGYLNAIDPSDVESMSVLKDASATALYGARASGGVIMITTKKGKKGSTRINFTSKVGVSSNAIPYYPRVSNSQYYELNWEALKQGYFDVNPGANVSEAETYAHDNLLPYVGGYNSFKEYPLNADGTFNTSVEERWGSGIWEDVVMGTGSRQEYHLDVSGQTDEGLSHYFSIGYLDDNASVTVSNFQRFSGRLNISQKVNDWFEAGLNASFSHGKVDSPLNSYSVRIVRDLPDIYPPWIYDTSVEDWARDENGDKLLYHAVQRQYDWPGGWYRKTWGGNNPLATARDSERKRENDNLSSRAFINLTLLPGLSIENSLNVDYAVSSTYEYWSSESSWAANSGGNAYRARARGITYTLTNLLRYEKEFNDHSINFIGGHEAYSYTWHSVSGNRQGFPTSSLTELGAASLITGAYSYVDNHTIESYLTNLDYNYKDRYYMSASFRRDGTSRFSPDSRWGNFWSLGGSWRISEEDFMKDYLWLDNLTLRLSYGSQGNERISGYYAWLGLYNTTKDLGNSGFELNSLTNTILQWESNIQTNIGFEANLFERFYVSFEYFNKKSQDLLFNRELPLSSGLGSVAENIGDVENKGFEFSFNSVNILIGDFRWETNLNMTHYNNVITSLPSKEISAGYHRYVEGRSVYDFYLRDYAGVNPSNGNALYYTNIYETDGSGNPVLDDNGDRIVTGKETTEVLTEASYYYVGSSLPDLYGNMVNSFFYKGLDLSINLLYNIGGKIYDSNYQALSRSGYRAETYSVDMMDHWTPENTDTDIPRMTNYTNIGSTFSATSSRFLADGTYARIRNLTLGYSLPKNLTSKIGLTKARIYLQGDNFLTLYKYKDRGTDPEVGVSGTTNINIPVQKVLSGGIQVTF